MATQPPIVCTDDILHGAPILAETRMPVQAITELWGFGVTPEDIVVCLPHLTLAQMSGTLSYYEKRRRAIDEDIEPQHASDDRIHLRIR